jgi:ketosteroid isomerase-like protein
VRTAAVTALDLVAADEADQRRGYRAVVTTATGLVGGARVTVASTAYLVLARQPDGRWLVAADTPDVPEVGE